MFAAASSFFSRTNISANYTIGGSGPSPSPRPGASPTPATPAAAQSINLPHAPTFKVGPWRVQSAAHKTSGKRVSVWDLDKRNPWLERLNPAARDRALEVLKAEATALMKLRHPSILEMVEPLEDTRSELIFATEPVISSLAISIPGSPSSRQSTVELDEIEIQKGILQLCKGLVFLHTSARMIHSNLDPESVIINSAGDWKVSGLGLTIPLTDPSGNPTRWEFPTYDGRLDSYVQRSFDYMAPEYALDEVLVTSSDLYSLGCLIYAVHRKGDPPFKNHGSLSGVRDTAGKPLPNISNLDTDLQALLRLLITRQPQSRPAPSTLPSQPFFNSLPISTLNFLERSTFATKSREEKVSFMRGLASVLGRFSQGLRVRKILPSLVEEMKDAQLLPAILPNVFAIAADLSLAQFSTIVLPSLKPLFVVKDPPQNMITLLDNLELLQSKTDKVSFRESVLPLVYNALDSEHVAVQERALKAVPSLCETIDYAEVQGTLFPRVAVVFTKTRSLSVKVATLATFLAMIETLDQTSLTQKLVPLLSKIRTKEPAVMMGTLAVQEAMGMKVDREAVATLVLPQLWAMCIGPMLNVEQFDRFMNVIRKLGERVAKEHDRFLRDSQRLEDRSALNAAATAAGGAVSVGGGPVDFESLVGQTAGLSVKQDSAPAPSWDDDPWGSILSAQSDTPRVQSPAPPPMIQPTRSVLAPQAGPSSVPPSPAAKSYQASPLSNGVPSTGGLGGLGLGPRSFTTPGITSTPSYQAPPLARPPVFSHPVMSTPAPSGWNDPPAAAFAPSPQPVAPNYNISLSPMAPAPAPAPPMMPSFGLQPMAASSGGMLAPSKPATPSWNPPKKPSEADWSSFDPLA